MGAVPFDKYEGLGNDFVVVEASSDAAWSADRVRALCDRRRGVGGDGVILVLPAARGGDARMRVMNADGSIPEMCGNGVRCFALHLARARGLVRHTFAIETDAGMRHCVIEDGSVRVEMGVVAVGDDVVIDGVTFTCADAGNPHAVALRSIERAEFERLGPRVATDARFPRGTNVEFAQLTSDGALRVDVWERGVGPTLACGTGACAAAVVAMRRGVVHGASVVVHLPGGPLAIERDKVTGDVTMTGPARHVFSGTADA